MEALFIGHAYTDITMVSDYMPKGDEKYVGDSYAFCVGGNAVVAAFTSAKLGIKTDLIAQVADDRLSDVFVTQCAKKGVRLFSRKVAKSSISLIFPNDSKRAVLRCRDDMYEKDFPKIDISEYGAVHIDGHQEDCALYYVKEARRKGILTSLDGGNVRANTDEILEYIDVAMVSEDFQKKLGLSAEETIKYLHKKGVKVAGVTQGSEGFIYSVGKGVIKVDAIYVPKEKIVDTCGAGDIFHGSYICSYLMNPTADWATHFNFARAASTLSVQKLGAEASIPTLEEVKWLAEK